jgi:hypothetical protein
MTNHAEFIAIHEADLGRLAGPVQLEIGFEIEREDAQGKTCHHCPIL